MEKKPAIFEYIDANNLDGVKSCLSAQSDINYITELEQTIVVEDETGGYAYHIGEKHLPIITAAMGGKLEIAKYLLSIGADINKTIATTRYPTTDCCHPNIDPNDPKYIICKLNALSGALSMRHFEVAEYLIDQGADLNMLYIYPTLDPVAELGDTPNHGDLPDPLTYSILQIALWARAPISIIRKICANGVPHKEHREEVVSRGQDATCLTLWIAGGVCIWIPCALGLLFCNETTRDAWLQKRSFNALELAEFMGNEEAVAVIKEAGDVHEVQATSAAPAMTR